MERVYIDGEYQVTERLDGSVERRIAPRQEAEAERTRPALSKVEIMRRITPAEWHAFTTSTDPMAIYALDVFRVATEVQRDDPLTQQLFGSLEQIGVLAAGRAAVILA